MDERLWFVARLLEGEKTAPCAEIGISRILNFRPSAIVLPSNHAHT
jgi:hypothetical protein